MATEQPGTTGHMIRSADGTLYFIPDHQLEQFRVPDERQERAQQIIEQGDPNFNLSESRLEAVTRLEGPPTNTAAYCAGRST